MVGKAPAHTDGKRGAETRDRILVEASRLFAVQGYHRTTTREIAGAVGISQPSLFFHFSSKKAIVEELCRLDLVPAVRRIEALALSPEDPAIKLFALVVGELQHILASAYDLRAHLSYEVLNDPDLATYRTLAGRFDDMVRLLIRAGQQTEDFIEIDPWVAEQVVSGVFARATLYSRDLPPGQQIDPRAAARIVLRGLLVEESALDRIAVEAAALIEALWGTS